MKAYENEVDTVIAEDMDDATKVWEETTGENFADYENEMEWSECDGNHELKIIFHDDPERVNLPENCETTEKRRNGVLIERIVKATINEWIKAHGRGFLCSTEW